MEQIKVGDVVTLKSGGPQMTVAEVKAIISSCYWFADKELKEAHFVSETLRIVPPTKAVEGSLSSRLA